MEVSLSLVIPGILVANRGNKDQVGGNPMPSTEIDSVLTTDEVINVLRISKPTILKYIHAGRLKAIKAGKGYRILQSELNRFLKGETGFGDA